MTQRTLDRVPSPPDPRRAAFDLATVVDTSTPRSYTWAVPFVLDQGQEGACVGHAAAHEAIARPAAVNFAARQLPDWAARARRAAQRPQAVAQAFAFDTYDWCRRNDEWAGEDYAGTSVAAGAKAMAVAGVWGEYRWTRNAQVLAAAVSRKGPAIIGVDWWTGFFQPDGDGFLKPTGQIEGGHAILVNGYSTRLRAFTLTNSWGPSWGRKGRAYVAEDVMAQLLRQGGEACLPLTRRA